MGEEVELPQTKAQSLTVQHKQRAYINIYLGLQFMISDLGYAISKQFDQSNGVVKGE